MAFSEALEQFQKNYSAGIERRYLRQRGSYYEALQKEHDHDNMSPEERQDYVNATDPILAEMDPNGMIGTGAEEAHPHYGLAQLAREQLRTATSRKEAHQTLGDLFRIQKDYRTEKKVQKQEQLDDELRQMITPRVQGMKEVADSDFPSRKPMILAQFAQLQQTLSQMAGGRVPFNPELVKAIAGWPQEDQMMLIGALEKGLQTDPHGTAQQFVKVMTAANPVDGLHQLFQLYQGEKASGDLNQPIPASKRDDHPASQMDAEINESEQRLAMAKRAAVIDPTKNIAAYNKEREHNFNLHQRRNFYEEVYPRGEEKLDDLQPDPDKPGLLRRVDFLDRKRQWIENHMSKITTLGAGYGPVSKEEHARLDQQLKETNAALKETSGYEKLDDYERRAMEHLRPGINLTDPVQVAAFRSSPQDMKNMRMLASAYKQDEKTDTALEGPSAVDKALRALGIHEGSAQYKKYKQMELDKLVAPTQFGAMTDENTKLTDENVEYWAKFVADGNDLPGFVSARNPALGQRIAKRASEIMAGEPANDLMQRRAQVKARTQMTKDYANMSVGKPGGNILALNTLAGHMSTLYDLNEKWRRTNVVPANELIRFARNMTGRADINNFDLAVHAISDELTRLFKQTSPSDTEIRAWEEKFGSAKSAHQIRGALRTGAELVESRMNALEGAWVGQMGDKKTMPVIINDKAKAAFERIRQPERSKAGQEIDQLLEGANKYLDKKYGGK